MLPRQLSFNSSVLPRLQFNPFHDVATSADSLHHAEVYIPSGTSSDPWSPAPSLGKLACFMTTYTTKDSM